jgi:TonB family protein
VRRATEPHIPLFLWIATALLVHLTGGEGAQRVAQVFGERMEVQRFADAVRRHVISANRPMEVALLEDKDLPPPPPEEKKAEPEPEQEAVPREPAKPETVQKVKPDEKNKLAQKPKEEEKPKEPEKPKEKEKEQKKAADEPKKDMPTMKVPNRIAVQQHVQDKNQKDNPNAEFIADDANHVDKQTQARITATDQNDANPTPGTSEQGPSPEPGNAHVNDIAHSEDSPGAPDHAPSESAAGGKVARNAEHTASGQNHPIQEVTPSTKQGRANGDVNGAQRPADTGVAQAQREPVPGTHAEEPSPDVLDSRNGTGAVGAPSDGKVARGAEPGRPLRLPPVKGQPNALDFLGLGASGLTPNGINLNLTPGAAIAAVGRDQLGRELIADGERRRSKHRGSWHTDGIERWRAAIENYNSTVKPGNQTALNTARVPFASYLNQIHNRLHPIFADSFLASLESLPSDSPMNKADMVTNIEIILDKDDGRIVKMGVTRSSGSTMFDVAALESVQNSSPFGKPPPIIVSPDGRVYLHWEFYRNPFYACSTYFAHPYLLKAAPEGAPSHLPSPATPTFGPREQPLPVPGVQGRGDLGQLDPSLSGRPQPRAE